MAGYQPCGCRDCFEIAVGEPGAMCSDCQGRCGPEFSTSAECQGPHAYGGVDGTGHCGSLACCGFLQADGDL